ncbi:amino acid/amide ABC transporter substrate-binding protein (HAAT family) [Hoeflea marina]|uniref:Amino acid/amide ABC transporter substrate-binding protein (HAAT family) n=1 Tax=Hoeflea marina TaxID=274592 RepID=A0A317PRP6_9HYPH|nr:hypothetical protein [Hoeflea marina]PWW04132.1 amino acid/amide ABC transporter substrate-binding protein (HAAT family) [Hoeflea marina]
MGRLRPILIAMACAALAACQAAGPGDVLAVQDAGNAARSTPSVQSIGSGPIRIALILSRPASEDPAVNVSDVRDGAALALDDLGGGKFSLTVFEGADSATQVEAQARAAQAAGARLIVGPVGSDHGRAVAALDAAQRPPVLALARNGAIAAAGVWTLYSDAVDSALEGARAAIAARQTDFVIIHPRSQPAGDLARLQRGIAALSGKVLALAPYPDGAAAGVLEALLSHKPAFAVAQAAIVLGRTEAAGSVIDTLAAGRLGNAVATAIATTDLPQAMYARPSAQGLIVARPAPMAAGVIDSRFAARFHRSPSRDAGIGYDTVAIAAALLGAGGDGAITAAALQSPRGFRALTGLFRFRADGSIERRHIVYRIENGSLQPLQEEGAGF